MTEPTEPTDPAATMARPVTGLRDREFLRQIAIVAAIGVVLQVVAGALGGIPIIDVVLFVGTLWVMYRTLVKRSP